MKKNYLKVGIVAATALVALAGCGNQGESTSVTSATSVPSTSEVPTVIDVQSVTLDKQNLDLYINDSIFLRATVLPENASVKTLNWTSSDDEVAMVAANGKVIGLKVGTAKITCSSVSNPDKLAECVVTVSKKDTTVHVEDITLDKTSADLYVNESLQLNASVLPENATNKKVNWTTSDDKVAYVSSDGKVYATAPGTAIITASSDEKPEIKKTCTLTITKKDTTVHVETVEISDTLVELDLGGVVSKQLQATVLPENATSKALSWSSSDSSKVSVDSANGTIRALKVTEGEPVVITARSVQDPDVFDTVSVTVDDTRDPTIHVTGVTVKANETLDLKSAPTKTLVPTIKPENAWNKNVSFESDDPTVVTVDEESGLMTAVSVGTATVTVTTEEGGFTADCEVTVIDSTVHVDHVVIKQDNVPIDEADIKLGGFINLSAQAVALGDDEPDNKGIIWSLVEEDASDYVGLTAMGENVLLTGKAATETALTLRATSAENAAIYKDISLTVTDPTIYPDHVVITVGGLETSETSIELNKTIYVTATVYPLDATENGINWEIITEDGDQYISLGGDEGSTISIFGKKLTEEEQKITVRASAKGDPLVYEDIDITVIDPTDVTKFVNFKMPASIALYEDATNEENLNSIDNLDEKDDLDIQYFDYAESEKSKLNYKVGDQGVFTYNPSAIVRLPHETEDTVITNPSVIKTLYLYNETEEKFESVAMDDYCTIENDVDYTFKSAAVGKHFKLSIVPDPSKYYTKTVIPFDFEFDVVHGYNVDSLAELSLFDNHQTAWNDYKIASGLGGVSAEGGLVLHKNISFVGSILPQSFIWTKDEVDAYIASNPTDFENWYKMVGFDVYGDDAYSQAYNYFVNSSKDYFAIFDRHTTHNGDDAQPFDIYGNTFSIDLSKLTGVAFINYHADSGEGMVDGYNGDGSHSELFGVNREFNNQTIENETVSFNNMTIIGNSPAKVDYPDFIKNMPEGDARTNKMKKWDNFINNLGKGGHILLKNDHTNTYLNNFISHDSFISVLSMNCNQISNRGLHMDRAISYDTYSNSIYLFGSKDNYVTNSWFTRAGGPLFLLDENPQDPDHSQSSAKNPCGIDLTNCYTHNPITGLESWFAMHPGSGDLVQQYIVTPGLTPSSPEELESKWVGAAMSKVPGSKKISRINEKGDGECDLIALSLTVGCFAAGTPPYTNIVQPTSSLNVNNPNCGSIDFNMAHTELGTPVPSAAGLVNHGLQNIVSPWFFETSAGGCFCLGQDVSSGDQGVFYDDPTKAFFGSYMSMFLNVDQKLSSGLKYFGVLLKTY